MCDYYDHCYKKYASKKLQVIREMQNLSFNSYI